ncbi:MAG TPA: hypothetical protein VD969_19730 [Symbiobacteriaceae bacterium]|nr:hypothetical protein [Symbiobacteriaceae bacterium]
MTAGERNLRRRLRADTYRPTVSVAELVWVVVAIVLTVGVGIVMPIYTAVVIRQVNPGEARQLLTLAGIGWCIFGLAMIHQRNARGR